MDPTNLKQIAESKFKHALFRKNLKERIEAQLVVAHNGGLFKSTTELIAFVSCWDTEEVFLIDQYYNPIKCDRLKLLAQLKESYQYAMNAWHIEFEKSKQIRTNSDV